jgi:hypothetical protein
MWYPRRLTTLWAFMACYKDSVTVLPIRERGIDMQICHVLKSVLRWDPKRPFWGVLYNGFNVCLMKRLQRCVLPVRLTNLFHYGFS